MDYKVSVEVARRRIAFYISAGNNNFRGSIEEQVREWSENQRHEGKTCLEIKMRGSKY
ncbi:MAG: hypothetical protein WAV32_10015 [Halobacteriota archaeon]